MNYKQFCFSACGDETIIADTGCSCIGDPFIVLVQLHPYIILQSSSVSCYTCSKLFHYIPRLNSVCNDYCIHEGCKGNTSCTANVTVFGVVVPSVPPTSYPSSHPSDHPSPELTIKPT